MIDNKNWLVKQLESATLKSYNAELNYDYYYTLDITSFIDEIQKSPYLTKYALLFALPNSNQSVDKLLIYDGTFGKEARMKVELIYLLY